MRMNDIEYEFVRDSIDKKNVARSARSTRTHCGKSGTVKFPSDYLSKKEIKAMSGECIKYASLKKPMSWEEFKALPNDLKKEYIVSIRERFGAPDKYIAEMLGTTGHTLSLWLRDLGLSAGKNAGNGRRKWNTEQFFAWIGGADLNAECAPVEETPSPDPDETINDSSILSDTESKCGSAEKVSAIPINGQMMFDCPAEQALNMLQMVFGNAKVHLNVVWSIVNDDEEATDD